ncbi:tRNA (cytosine(38)-C(5))-methyltransferase-like [Styela clava]
MEDIRALELYCGIGGMHFALKKICPSAKIVAAVDISPNANKVYAHNFPQVKLMEKGIEGFSVKMLDKLNFNMVLMSPPCQPFTRIGLQKDVADPRTKSFLHFLSVLPKLSKLPKYILLENVKGFETSEAHKELVKTLNACKYNQQEFLLSPRHLGIPNSRLRYFMLAKRDKFHYNLSKQNNQIWECLPIPVSIIPGVQQSLLELETTENSSEPSAKRAKLESKEVQNGTEHNQSECDSVELQTIEAFLEPNPPEDSFVPSKIIQRYLGVVDIVTKYSTNSTCFTKSYTQYAEGTGSILNMKNTKSKTHISSNMEPNIKDFRYFTPTEVANLMCFPKHLSFPEEISKKQRYKLLGNSLNVNVVSYLISLLLLVNKEILT